MPCEAVCRPTSQARRSPCLRGAVWHLSTALLRPSNDFSSLFQIPKSPPMDRFRESESK